MGETMKISIDGLYYSSKSGKIFEATLKRKKVHIKYLDGTSGLVMDVRIFILQCLILRLYDCLAGYETGDYDCLS